MQEAMLMNNIIMKKRDAVSIEVSGLFRKDMNFLKTSFDFRGGQKR